MKAVYILWDASQIWGLLAVRAVRELGVPHAPVRAADVAAGLLRRDPAPLLIVPGGPARLKAAALGAAGMEEIRAYVRAGGVYLGFCGGAGLALSTPDGLALCPLQRAAFTERLQHFMSGHLHVRLRPEACPELLPEGLGPDVELPVWWPGRFEAVPGNGVCVPAEFVGPAEDFCLADLPISGLPAGTFEAWRDLYGFSPTPSFLEGSPCMVTGEYGAGRYILSYSHLETPASPHAGRMFAHLLRRFGGCAPRREDVPEWDPARAPETPPPPLPARLWEVCAPVFDLGREHGLLFTRTPWLLGWRTGIPGAALNSLRAALACARSLPFSEQAHAFALRHEAGMIRAAELFAAGCSEYLLTERLAQTLAKALPDTLPPPLLTARREALFGAPMQPAGPFQALSAPLEELTFILLRDNADSL